MKNPPWPPLITGFSSCDNYPDTGGGVAEEAQVGTSIRVFIDGKKIPKDEDENQVEPLNVTKYLSQIAGFVELPILVTEGNKKTIILHPKYDSKSAHQRFGEDFEIQKLNLSYPWSHIFLPQDLKDSQELLEEKIVDINSDLNVEGYEGSITYLTPHSFEKDFQQVHTTQYIHDGAVEIDRKKDGTKTAPIRWHRISDYLFRDKTGISSSSKSSPLYSVFRDGILISSVSIPKTLQMGIHTDMWLPPRIVVNISKSIAPKVDLARREILEKKESWDTPIYKAYVKKITKSFMKVMLKQSPIERFYRLGHIAAYHSIEIKDLWENFPHIKWPMAFLDMGGKLRVFEWGEVSSDVICLAPKNIANLLADLINRKLLTNEKYSGPLSKWNGEKFLISSLGYARLSYAISKAKKMWEPPLKQLYYLDGVRFLDPPLKYEPPLLQKILSKKEVSHKLLEDEKILERAIIDPCKLSLEERTYLYENILRYKLGFSFPEFANFLEPFDKTFGYSLEFLNLRHPTTQALIKIISALRLAEIHKTLPEDRIGKLKDQFNWLFKYRSSRYDLEQFLIDIKKLLVMVNEFELIEIENIEKLLLSHDEFVAGTVQSVEKNHWIINTSSYEINDKYDYFGKVCV